jgi:hypothetical protein
MQAARRWVCMVGKCRARSPFRRAGPPIEGRAISQLLETLPERDDAQQQSEMRQQTCFH